MIACPQATEVPAERWRQAAADLLAEGYDVLDFLTAVDAGEVLQVLALLKKSADGDRAMLMSVLTREDPRIDSLVPVYPGVSWHERETREMLGVEFDGLDDPRPLLLRQAPEEPPLLRSQALAARRERDWPGAAEPEVAADGRRLGNPSRRRQLPLGVADESQGPRGRR